MTLNGYVSCKKSTHKSPSIICTMLLLVGQVFVVWFAVLQKPHDFSFSFYIDDFIYWKSSFCSYIDMFLLLDSVGDVLEGSVRLVILLSFMFVNKFL